MGLIFFDTSKIKTCEWKDLNGLECTIRHFESVDGEILVATTDNNEIYIIGSKINIEEKRYCI